MVTRACEETGFLPLYRHCPARLGLALPNRPQRDIVQLLFIVIADSLNVGHDSVVHDEAKHSSRSDGDKCFLSNRFISVC